MRSKIVETIVNAQVAELVDALVLEASVFDVRVRVPPWAPRHGCNTLPGWWNW